MAAASIDALACHVRLPAGATLGAASRLDRLAREMLPSRLGEKLAKTLPADQRVVLIRSLAVRSRLKADTASEEDISREWTRQLVEKIELARGEADSEKVRVFPDHAAWIAACVTDRLEAEGAPPWWFGPLGRDVGNKPRAQAIAQLLAGERLLAPVLALLARQGKIERVIDALPPSQQARILAGAPPETSRRDRLRPILAAALARLALRLSASEAEALLDRWMMEENPSEADWTNGRAMAGAVLAACHFLLRGESPAAARGAINAAIELGDGPSWLDAEQLRQELRELANGTQPRALPESASAALLAAVAASRREPDRLALLALARLARTNPKLGGDLHIQTVVRFAAPLLLTLLALPRSERRPALAALRGGRGPLAAAASEPASRAVRADVTALLEQALDADVASSRQRQSNTSPLEAAGVECASAGVGVLLRAIRDVDLARALADARRSGLSLPDAPTVAAALLALWAGAPGFDDDGRIDPGLRFLLGDGAPRDAVQLQAALGVANPAAWGALVGLVEATIDAQTSGRSRSDRVSAAESFAEDMPLAFDPALQRIASRLVQHWARWLGGFDGSSARWLLDNIVRRPGRMFRAGGDLYVTLPARSFDAALRRAGYLDPYSPPFSSWRRIVIGIAGEAL